MNGERNYGLIVKHLRTMAGLSVQLLAKKIGKSAGWVSEIENENGRCRLTEQAFEQIVEALDGKSRRAMFRTWVANHKNLERVDRTFDGAVLKYIRRRQGISVPTAAQLTGLSMSHLSNLENGKRNMTHDLRVRLMKTYGYSPSSFKNLSTDPVRSKAVPCLYKLKILLGQMSDHQIEAVYNFARNLVSQNQNEEF